MCTRLIDENRYSKYNDIINDNYSLVLPEIKNVQDWVKGLSSQQKSILVNVCLYSLSNSSGDLLLAKVILDTCGFDYKKYINNKAKVNAKTNSEAIQAIYNKNNNTLYKDFVYRYNNMEDVLRDDKGNEINTDNEVDTDTDTDTDEDEEDDKDVIIQQILDFINLDEINTFLVKYVKNVTGVDYTDFNYESLSRLSIDRLEEIYNSLEDFYSGEFKSLIYAINRYLVIIDDMLFAYDKKFMYTDFYSNINDIINRYFKEDMSEIDNLRHILGILKVYARFSPKILRVMLTQKIDVDVLIPIFSKDSYRIFNNNPQLYGIKNGDMYKSMFYDDVFKKELKSELKKELKDNKPKPDKLTALYKLEKELNRELTKYETNLMTGKPLPEISGLISQFNKLKSEIHEFKLVVPIKERVEWLDEKLSDAQKLLKIGKQLKDEEYILEKQAIIDKIIAFKDTLPKEGFIEMIIGRTNIDKVLQRDLENRRLKSNLKENKQDNKPDNNHDKLIQLNKLESKLIEKMHEKTIYEINNKSDKSGFESVLKEYNKLKKELVGKNMMLEMTVQERLARLQTRLQHAIELEKMYDKAYIKSKSITHKVGQIEKKDTIIKIKKEIERLTKENKNSRIKVLIGRITGNPSEYFNCLDALISAGISGNDLSRKFNKFSLTHHPDKKGPNELYTKVLGCKNKLQELFK